jgi:hypothetical protein
MIISASLVVARQGGGPIPDPKAPVRAQQSGGVDPARSRRASHSASPPRGCAEGKTIIGDVDLVWTDGERLM